MNYKFTINLTAEMDANSELELVEKVSKIINNNHLFNKLSEVFYINLDRESIEGEEDILLLDKISNDFNLKIKEKEFNLKKKEILLHEININSLGDNDA